MNDEVFALWDALADYPAAQTDAALSHLLHELSRQLNAQDAYWLGAVRVNDPLESDPYQGWRPLRMHSLNSQLQHQSSEIGQRLQRAVMRGKVIDPITEHIKQAGEFRVQTLREMMPRAFFQSEHYQTTYAARDISDTLFVVVPVNSDAESYFGFHRCGDETFTPSEKQLAGTVLRAIRWFHCQLFLSHGLQIGRSPLPPAHRRVLHQLLTRDSEAAIAERLDLSPATVHTYVREIYRSLGVSSRAGLAALWLGENS